MGQKLHQIFKEIHEIDPPHGLRELILQKIDLEKNKRLRRKIYMSYLGFSASVAATLSAFFIFGKSILNSEFWSMISLVFSDLMIVASHWDRFLYSLLETFPVVNIVAVLVPVFTLLLSLNFILSFTRKNNHKLYFN